MVKQILFFFLKGKIEKNGNTKRDKKSRFAKILRAPFVRGIGRIPLFLRHQIVLQQSGPFILGADSSKIFAITGRKQRFVQVTLLIYRCLSNIINRYKTMSLKQNISRCSSNFYSRCRNNTFVEAYIVLKLDWNNFLYVFSLLLLYKMHPRC